MPGKRTTKTRRLSDADRRRMIRGLVDDGSQGEFPFGPDCSLELSPLTWGPSPETEAAPALKKKSFGPRQLTFPL
jgi:hypothetical protein